MAGFPGEADCTGSKYSAAFSHDIQTQLKLSNSQVSLGVQDTLK